MQFGTFRCKTLARYLFELSTASHRFDGTHFGLIFLAKAPTPILKFGPSISRRVYSSLIREVACWTLAVSHASLRPCLVTMTASGEKLAICSAKSRHSSTTDSGVFDILLMM